MNNFLISFRDDFMIGINFYRLEVISGEHYFNNTRIELFDRLGTDILIINESDRTLSGVKAKILSELLLYKTHINAKLFQVLEEKIELIMHILEVFTNEV